MHIGLKLPEQQPTRKHTIKDPKIQFLSVNEKFFQLAAILILRKLFSKTTLQTVFICSFQKTFYPKI
jgi:hypothetical protein